MEPEASPVRCGTCNTAINEPIGIPPELRSPCPVCGSMSRKFFKDDLGGQLTPVANLKARGFQSGIKQWFVEIIKGADWSTRLGRWVRKLRVIDRKNDRYTETVVDPSTGQTIHQADEPLSDHTGHGSAKKP